MTDTERKRIDAICEVAGVKEIDDLSDGFHTFRQLYYQRMMLFATIVKQNKDKAWKSLRHEDGELCFGGGWFIVGIDTPEGSYTYHYENKYFDLFDCEILDYGKHWDGHTEKDVTRLLSLESNHSEIPNSSDCIDRAEAQTAIQFAARRYTVAHEAHGEGHVVWSDNLISVTDAMNALREVPSAQPERKKGEWITQEFGSWAECSECHELYDIPIACSNFCPNCGSDMRTKETDCDYERAVEQLEHDMLYEPTFNPNDGSM